MVELSGLEIKDENNPDGDIEIEVTGLRAGEKLFEELLIGDNAKPTPHPRIMKAHEEFLPWPVLMARLGQLENALAANDLSAIEALLTELVSGYKHRSEQEGASETDGGFLSAQERRHYH
jgi:FlaA1/EpsC-like NDP-sugar epimerase